MRRWGCVLVAVAMSAMAACTAEPGVRATGANVLDQYAGETLEVDGATRLITLDNGLVVYLRQNNRPGGAADMRLAINAGSALEEADQAGGAHFLEHMLFNGTEQFPGNDLVDVLRDFGMEFGADLNAYTSYDETVYELSVPLSDPDNLGTGLDVLQQWLSAATLDDDDVVEERGVVLDEWRVREETLQGRQAAVLDTMFLTGSVYDGHQPIGGEQQIEGMTAEPLRRYYDTWYRPDNAAVIVVGDFDVDEVEAMIHDRFDGLAARGDTTPRPPLALERFAETVVAVAADPDETQAVAELTYPAPATALDDTGAVRDDMLVQLAFDMISNRLSDDVALGQAPFRDAATSSNDSVRAIRAPSVWMNADPLQAAEAIDALLVEFERARRFGFDDNEVARAVDPYRANVESTYEARDTVQDRNHADAMVQHFLTGAFISDADTEYETYVSLLDSVTAADVSAEFEAFTAASAPHLFVGVPDDLADAPSEAELAAQIQQLGERDIQPREATQAVGDELMVAPDPVQEAGSDVFASEPSAFLDATRLEFANGAVVILNPTDISDGFIAIDARSPGGLAMVLDTDVLAARYAPQVAALSGVGELDPVAVETVLGRSSIELDPYIDQTTEGFWGSTAPEDLELAFQLMHLYLTAPRFTQNGLDSVVDGDRPYIDDPLADPDFAAYDALVRARYGDDPRYALVPTAAEAEALTLDDIEAAFRDRFTNADDWVFVLSGDFDVDEATEIARRYVGTLDATGDTERPLPTTAPPPTSVVPLEVRAGTGETASLTLLYTEPSDGSEYEYVAAALLTQVMSNRLTDHIRETLGASYSPYAEVTSWPAPTSQVETYVYVSGAPDGMQQLAEAVQADLTDLALNGPTADEYDAAVAALEKEYQLFSNESLSNVLHDTEADANSLKVFLAEYFAIRDITAAALQQFAARVLPAQRYIQVTQLPA